MIKMLWESVSPLTWGSLVTNKLRHKPRVPKLDNVRLIKYDFQKYGKAVERKRLIERWEREVNPLPR